MLFLLRLQSNSLPALVEAGFLGRLRCWKNRLFVFFELIDQRIWSQS